MKRSRGFHLRSIVFLAASAVACTTSNGSPGEGSGGRAGLGGSSGAAGAAGSTPASGAAGTHGNGGSTGGGARGAAGTTGGGGTTGGATTSGAAGSSGASGTAGEGVDGAAGGGGRPDGDRDAAVVGTGGTGIDAAAGAGGTGGASDSPGAELDGLQWLMPCNKADTDPGAADRCYLLPPGQNSCPQGGYTSVDKTIQFGGTPGTMYDVTLHIQGSHEYGDYSGGMTLGQHMLKNATHSNGGVHTWLSMEVSSPMATYNPNGGGQAGTVGVFDYMATIQVAGGATLRLKASDADCLMHRYCQGNVLNPCKAYTVSGITGTPTDGSWMNLHVVSVAPAK
jgi:hypothetical protein